MPIAAVDDIELPSAPGPVTLDVHERLARRIELELGAPAYPWARAPGRRRLALHVPEHVASGGERGT